MNKKFKVSLVAIVLGFVVSAAVVALTAEGGFIESFIGFFMTYIQTIFQMPSNIINKAALYIMLGISVAIGFKAGVFNIGAAGQMFAGQYFSVVAVVALAGAGITGAPAWIIGLIVGALAGVLVGLVPALMKSFLGLHEVVTTIMFNYLTVYLVNFLMTWKESPTAFASNGSTGTVSVAEYGCAIPQIGEISIIIFFAIGIFLAYDYIMKHTTLGLEIKAVGFNKEAARNAGINVNRKMLQVFLISAGLAGFAGACFTLGVDYAVAVTSAPPADGFNGINIAIVGANTGIGIALVGTLFASLTIAANPIQSGLGVSLMATQLTTSLILLFACSQYGIEKYLDKMAVKNAANIAKEKEKTALKKKEKADKKGGK